MTHKIAPVLAALNCLQTAGDRVRDLVAENAGLTVYDKILINTISVNTGPKIVNITTEDYTLVMSINRMRDHSIRIRGLGVATRTHDYNRVLDIVSLMCSQFIESRKTVNAFATQEELDAGKW